jgi:hypothetical protein
MTNIDKTACYLEPTKESGRAIIMRQMKGQIVMLNLLRFSETADYSATLGLAPQTPISGAEAFQKYIDHTLPYLRETDGEPLFLVSGGPFLIGPETERWDDHADTATKRRLVPGLCHPGLPGRVQPRPALFPSRERVNSR